MKIDQAEFIISAVSKQQYPHDFLPEIALAGRSNVGKSSFVNRMIQRRKLAKTSSTPGKTQTINFYKINQLFYFVDVPGYGYARVSKKVRDQWGGMMEEYFQSREQLQIVILLTDIRHPPTNDDLQMYEYLSFFNVPVIVIGTKYDKVKKNQQRQVIQRMENSFHITAGVDFIPFSAQTGEGRQATWKILKEYLQ